MKLRIKNYRRFVVMAVLTSLVIFFICWGIVALVQRMIINRGTTQVENVAAEETVIQPRNPSSPYLILVNEQNPMAADYEPEDLVLLDVPSSESILLSQEAATQLKRLFEAASAQGLDLLAISGYRSYEEQQALNSQAATSEDPNVGLENAPAGTSEHQTGFAIDLASDETDYTLRQDFALTEAGKWVADHAVDYGFVIRYPQGKETITGNIYEPWHLRYVGLEDAKKLVDNNLVLEEYITPANSNNNTESEQTNESGDDSAQN